MFLKSLTHNWWLVALRGLLAILFGVAAFLWPAPTLLVLVFLFAGYAVADGVLALVTGFMDRRGRGGWWLVLEGLVGIAAGVLAFLFPTFATLVLVYFIAAWAVVTGLLEVVAAISLRHEIENEWALGFGGVLSVAVGAVLFIWPGDSALALVWLIGVYAVLFGVLLVVLGFRLRGWRGQAQPRELGTA